MHFARKSRKHIAVLRLLDVLSNRGRDDYSHSMVDGGFEEMS